MFPQRHRLTDADIANALGILHENCTLMTAQDVAELYNFLETNPDLHTNAIRMWQAIKVDKTKNKEDQVKVALAIGRFTNVVTVGKR